MPRSRAIERREMAAAPSRATWAPATARISAVISSRTLSLAVRGADVAETVSSTWVKSDRSSVRTQVLDKNTVHV